MLFLLAGCKGYKKYNFDFINKSYASLEKHLLKVRLIKGNIFSLNIKPENDIIDKIIYKPIPFIYHRIPSQEDIYALFRLNANKIAKMPIKMDTAHSCEM